MQNCSRSVCTGRWHYMNEFDARELEYRHTTPRMREAMLEIYHHCALCGGVRSLSCHHWWFPFKSCRSFSCSVAIVNIVVVCRACHRALHTMPLAKARERVMPFVAAKLHTSPQDLRAILDGHCARRHVLDSLLSSL